MCGVFSFFYFGRRVHKNYDPRAHALLRQVCADVLGEMTSLTPELALARELEKAALADEYFVKRKLYPNVDFYSGIVLRALGIPRNMFTVLFAVARTAGWLAQWNESFADAQQVFDFSTQTTHFSHMSHTPLPHISEFNSLFEGITSDGSH